MRSLKKRTLDLVTAAGLTQVFRPLLSGRATVFMLHRFDDPARGVHGGSPARLRESLAYLRRTGHDLLDLEELVRAQIEGRDLGRKAVAFTIDDGYYDHAEIAAPIFAEFECPVTVFVTSGFLDRELWFWWDRIEYAFEHAARTQVRVPLGDQLLAYDLGTPASRGAARHDFTERCKRVPDAVKLAAIAALPEALDVELPVEAPPRYAPMTWDQLRACERMGVRFGPHTVTHPVLAQTPDAQVRHELAHSWQRLCEEASRPVPVFCYPNGQFTDFGDREIAILREIGMVGAVVGAAGYADARRTRSGPRGPFEVHRFAMPDELPYVVQYASGAERFKQLVRGMVR